MTSELRVHQSCGNVFADLGLPESEELLAKAQLVSRISAIVEERGLSQAQAAEVLDATQPIVSNLMNGRLNGFSIERLLRFLNALGQEVEIVVKSRGKSTAGLTVQIDE